MRLTTAYFNCDPQILARQLLGKVIRVKYANQWLSAQIIETEAYYLHDKASHAALGYTAKRKALFMPAGTIYMYYARGAPSLNISAQGPGNAVLIKSGWPLGDKKMLALMQQLNPPKNGHGVRRCEKLCAGQTLLCRSLNLTVKQWDQQQFDPHKFYLDDIHYQPEKIIQTTRLGIPHGRDEQLPYRFIDQAYQSFCTPKSTDSNKKNNLSLEKSYL